MYRNSGICGTKTKPMRLSKLVNNFQMQIVLSKLGLCGPYAFEEQVSYEGQIQIFVELI